MSDDKALIVLGPRQVGKTTLLQAVAVGIPNVLWLTGDDPDTKALFDGATSTRLKALLVGHEVLVIDEAQRIPDIGLKIKLIKDHVPGTKVIATGSSS
jgi:predicted AAA+ superfamily ATPase